MEEYMATTDPFEVSSNTSSGFQKKDLCKTLGIGNINKTAISVCNLQQKLWVCTQYSNDHWVLLNSSSKNVPLKKSHFKICCKVPAPLFYHSSPEIEPEQDPFACDAEISLPEAPILRFAAPTTPCGNLKIDASLFVTLFGQEASLSAPGTFVCLIGFPDGRLQCWQHPNDRSLLLCNMRQPVVDILQGPDGCLLIIGFHGKLLSIGLYQKALKYSCAFLSGPVTSACYKDKQLFHTTSSQQLFRSEINKDAVGQISINELLLPVVSAKRVLYDTERDKVWFLDAQNIPHDLPTLSLDQSLSVDLQRQNLRVLIEAISEQMLRTQELTELTDKYSAALHDLTCAAWLLTPEHCGLECSCEVFLVSCEEHEFAIRVTFKGLAKLCASRCWTAGISLSQSKPNLQARQFSKSVSVSKDIITMDMRIKLCWGSNVPSWGGTFRPPLDLHCSVLFNGEAMDLGTNTVMQFPLRKFLLDEFYFLNSAGTQKNLKSYGILDSLLYDIAEGKKRLIVDRPLIPSVPCNAKCRIGFLISGTVNPGSILWDLLVVSVSKKGDKSLWLLDESVLFRLTDPTDSEIAAKNGASICIEANCISVVASLRRAAVERIKDITLSSKENVAISKEALVTAQRLLSKFKEAESGRSVENAARFYLTLRNELSAHLPIL